MLPQTRSVTRNNERYSLHCSVHRRAYPGWYFGLLAEMASSAVSTENPCHVICVIVLIVFLQMHVICASIVVQGGDAMDMNMTCSVTVQESIQNVPRAQMLADADQMLADFAEDYKELAK